MAWQQQQQALARLRQLRWLVVRQQQQQQVLAMLPTTTCWSTSRAWLSCWLTCRRSWRLRMCRSWQKCR
jgi:hypothetical protein